jgi:hypothetical protein
MPKANHIRLYLIAVFTITTSCLVAFAEDSTESSKTKLATLNKRVEDIDSNLGTLRTQIIGVTGDFQIFQHDIVYTNSVPATLYKEIVKIEKVLVKKRKELQAITYKHPGAKKFIVDRDRLVKKKQNLFELRTLLTNEIKVLNSRVAQAEAKKNESK